MLTALVAAVLAIAPGGLLGFAVQPGLTRWAVWSVAPVLSLGLTAVGMAWLPALGLPRTVTAVLVAEFALALAAVGAGWWRSRHDGLRRWSVTAGRPRWADVAGAGIPAAVCAGFGVAFFRSFTQPPGWDAMYHGMLTREMLEKGTTVASAVCTTGSTHPEVACHFYPLAADVQWGQAATLSGGRIGAAMLAWEAVIGPVALVVAVFALLRLLGARTVVASAAAGAVTVVGPLWMSTLTGRITQEIAPGLAVSVVVLVVAAVRSNRPWSLGALAGVAAAGLLLTHSYEVLFAGVLALAVPATVATLRRRAAVWTLIATAVAGLVSVAPMLATVLGADSERASVKAYLPGNLSGAFRFWILNFQRYVVYGYPSPSAGDFPLKHATVHAAAVLTVVCLLGSPLCFAFRELRWARPWFVVATFWTVIGIWTAVSNSTAALFVSGLWYGVQERLRSMILPIYGVLTVVGACALVLCAQRVLRRVRRRELRPYWPGAVAAVVVAVLLAVALAPSARRPVAHDMSVRTPHGPSYPAAFRWLAAHTDRGKVIAYALNLEMITWSYVDDRVGYLFGLPPVLDTSSHGFADRVSAWNWLVNNPEAAPAGCLVSRFGIEYVVVGKARVPGFPATYQRALLARSPRVDLVHQVGAIKIYKVNANGTACAATTPG